MTGPPPGDPSDGRRDVPEVDDPRLRIPEVLRKPPELPRSAARPSRESSLAGAARAWAVAFDFIGTVLAGALAGWLLDRWLGWTPWALLAGLCLGFAGAFYRIVRATSRGGSGRG